MSKPLPTFQDVLLARRVIAPYLPPTPLHHYPQLDTLLGATVFVKHENYQPIGAFKVRGGINFMAHLAPEERQRGVVTASTGNHGQSVAYAAQLFGVRAVIVVPDNASAVKVNAMRAYGAEVVFYGADFEASKLHCLTLEEEQGLRFVSSGDEPLLIAGVATHTLEILETQPAIDVIFAPVGGGSGCAGACLVAKTVNPHIQVIGVAANAGRIGFGERPLHRRQAYRVRRLAWQGRAESYLEFLYTRQGPRGLHQRTLAALGGRKRRLVRPVAQTTFTRVIASGNSAANARW